MCFSNNNERYQERLQITLFKFNKSFEIFRVLQVNNGQTVTLISRMPNINYKLILYYINYFAIAHCIELLSMKQLPGFHKYSVL